VIADALEGLVGAAFVLDADLRVVVASPGVAALLGWDLPIGESAPKLLCGPGSMRPVAEALAAGRPVATTIPNPRDASHRIAVRTLPLGSEAAPTGSLVLLHDAAPGESDGAVEFHGMLTQDAAMKEVFRIVTRVAEGDYTVLVRGETGSGKELVAHAIHALSARKDGPFRAINCAAVPGNLLESELFGHVRGAFTGAVRDVAGHVQLANKGTLFLDEVAELPLELQAKILRVIETRSVVPVGGREPVPVDVRFVSATHRALRKEVEAGRFRADLMYRLRVIPVFLPPLRARRGDVSLLAERLLAEMNGKGRRTIEQIAPSAMEALEAHDWPGNVRELRNVMAYAYAIGEGAVLLPSDLPPEVLGALEARDEGADEAFAAQTSGLTDEAQRITAVLARADGSRERAAKILGMSRVTLWRRMKELGLVTR